MYVQTLERLCDYEKTKQKLLMAVTQTSQRTKRPTVKLRFKDMEITALVDSGASLTCLSSTLFKSLAATDLVKRLRMPKAVNFKSASGHKLTVDQLTVLQFEVPGLGMVKWPCLVMSELSSPFILGNCFLTAHGAQLDFATQGLTFHPSIQRRTATVQKSFWLPPGTARFITAVAPEVQVGKKYIVHDYENGTATYGLQTATTNGRIALHIVNNTEKAQVYSKGENLASLEPINDADIFTIEEIMKSDTVKNKFQGEKPETRMPEQSSGKLKSETSGKLKSETSGKLKSETDLQGQKQKKVKPEPDEKKKPETKISQEKKAHLLGNCTTDMKGEEKKKLETLILSYHDVFSADKFDIGNVDTVPHKLHMKTEEPIFTKQFPIPEAHTEFINKQVEGLLKQRCITEDYATPHNSPIFCVKKPHSNELRLVHDLRKINENMYDQLHTFLDVPSCLNKLGHLQASVFSTLDLTSAYWQQSLHEESRQYTGFTVPGKGRFVWNVSSMGLKSSPSAFCRLMEHVFKNLIFTIIYLDDIMVASKNNDTHFENLEDCFKRLRAYGLKLNMKKCSFGTESVHYLGYNISKSGIRPGAEKTEAVAKFPPPANIKQVRQFLGLANYFRQLIPNFATQAAHLTVLTSKKTDWKEGELPTSAKIAFNNIKQALCEKPLISFPDPKLPYILTTDASTGTETTPGGYGAVLTQIQNGTEKVIAYASSTLKEHEKNYTTFAAEMAAAVFAIEHFHVYLHNNRFTLYMDHRPLEKVSTVHKRTLNRLQELLNQYTFELRYKPGVENTAADALSRNAVDSIQPFATSLLQEQGKDVFCRAVKTVLQKSTLPKELDPAAKRYLKQIASYCQVTEQGYLTIQLKRGELSKVVLPKHFQHQIIHAAHASRLGGHGGVLRTLNRLRGAYWWPAMAKQVEKYVSTCEVCQKVKDPPKMNKNKEPLHPLQVPDVPNCRVHADLFGPLKTSETGNKYVLVITDAFSKWTELVAIPNKEAETVAAAMYFRWICKHSCPKLIITDGGKEFCNKISAELFRYLEVKHVHTSAMHPQTNTSAESYNRFMIRYLAAMLENPDGDWEHWLPIVSLSYNTAIHAATRMSPFYLTYLREPSLPYFDLEANRPLYGEDWATNIYARQKHAYRQAKTAIEESQAADKSRYDVGTSHITFLPGERVLVKFPRSHFRAIQNKKFVQTWQAFVVQKRITETTYLLRRVLPAGGLGQQSLVHRNRLKKFSLSDCTGTSPTMSNNSDSPGGYVLMENANNEDYWGNANFQQYLAINELAPQQPNQHFDPVAAEEQFADRLQVNQAINNRAHQETRYTTTPPHPYEDLLHANRQVIGPVANHHEGHAGAQHRQEQEDAVEQALDLRRQEDEDYQLRQEAIQLQYEVQQLQLAEDRRFREAALRQQQQQADAARQQQEEDRLQQQHLQEHRQEVARQAEVRRQQQAHAEVQRQLLRNEVADQLADPYYTFNDPRYNNNESQHQPSRRQDPSAPVQVPLPQYPQVEVVRQRDVQVQDPLAVPVVLVHPPTALTAPQPSTSTALHSTTLPTFSSFQPQEQHVFRPVEQQQPQYDQSYQHDEGDEVYPSSFAQASYEGAAKYVQPDFGYQKYYEHQAQLKQEQQQQQQQQEDEQDEDDLNNTIVEQPRPQSTSTPTHAATNTKHKQPPAEVHTYQEPPQARRQEQEQEGALGQQNRQTENQGQERVSRAAEGITRQLQETTVTDPSDVADRQQQPAAGHQQQDGAGQQQGQVIPETQQPKPKKKKISPAAALAQAVYEPVNNTVVKRLTNTDPTRSVTRSHPDADLVTELALPRRGLEYRDKIKR